MQVAFEAHQTHSWHSC